MSDRCGVQPCCQKIQKYLLNLENITVFKFTFRQEDRETHGCKPAVEG